MHISSPINAIEDVYVTLRNFLEIKVSSKMADSRFFMEMSHVFRFALCFAFSIAQNYICQKMVDISTHLSLFNVLISKGDIQDGGD